MNPKHTLTCLGFICTCKKLCDHPDTDDHCCRECEKDLTEDRAAHAFDRAKDLRKYGDS